MLTRTITVCFLLATPVLLPAQTLRAQLLRQLRTTHNQQEWFVPVNRAVAGLTPAQASWTDGKGNHSVGQLANHLLFWNRRELQKFTGEKAPAFSGNNDETFNQFDAKTWTATVHDLDQVLTNLEKVVADADESKLQKIAPELGNIATHNAYHTGQIIFVRKEQGVWNPDKGVK